MNAMAVEPLKERSLKLPPMQGHREVSYSQNTAFGRFVNVRACDKCGGEGTIITDPCHKCNGRKELEK